LSCFLSLSFLAPFLTFGPTPIPSPSWVWLMLPPHFFSHGNRCRVINVQFLSRQVHLFPSIKLPCLDPFWFLAFSQSQFFGKRQSCLCTYPQPDPVSADSKPSPIRTPLKLSFVLFSQCFSPSYPRIWPLFPLVALFEYTLPIYASFLIRQDLRPRVSLIHLPPAIPPAFPLSLPSLS